MFEIFGPVARPTPSVVPLVLALLPLFGVLACLRDAARARRDAIISGSLTAAAAAFVLVVSVRWPAEQRFVSTHLGVAARIGQLDLVLGLMLDPLAAFASAATSIVTVLLVAAQHSRRRIALLCMMGCATQFVVMADGATTFLLAGAVVGAIGAALGYVHS